MSYQNFLCSLVKSYFILGGNSGLYNMDALPCAHMKSIFIHLK